MTVTKRQLIDEVLEEVDGRQAMPRLMDFLASRRQPGPGPVAPGPQMPLAAQPEQVEPASTPPPQAPARERKRVPFVRGK